VPVSTGCPPSRGRDWHRDAEQLQHAECVQSTAIASLRSLGGRVGRGQCVGTAVYHHGESCCLRIPCSVLSLMPCCALLLRLQSFLFLQLLSLGVSPGIAFHDAKIACRQVCGTEDVSAVGLVSRRVVVSLLGLSLRGVDVCLQPFVAPLQMTYHCRC
jgi:hypothetical protein